MRENKYEIDSIVLNYAEGPKNGVPILLVHGNMSRWQVFSPILPGLKSDMHVFALDLRGHGMSSHLPGTYMLQNHMSDVVSFIRDVIGSPVILLGESLGGMIGLMAAANNPELIRSVILADSPLTLETLEPIIESQMSLAELIIHYKATNQIEELYKELKDDFAAESMWACDIDILKTTFYNHKKMFDGFEIEKLLPLIKSPISVIRGRQELGSMISDEDMRKVSAMCPQLTQRQVGDAGHSLLTRNELVLDVIARLL